MQYRSMCYVLMLLFIVVQWLSKFGENSSEGLFGRRSVHNIEYDDCLSHHCCALQYNNTGQQMHALGKIFCVFVCGVYSALCVHAFCVPDTCALLSLCDAQRVASKMAINCHPAVV